MNFIFLYLEIFVFCNYISVSKCINDTSACFYNFQVLTSYVFKVTAFHVLQRTVMHVQFSAVQSVLALKS
jgi:hypothetical protein